MNNALEQKIREKAAAFSADLVGFGGAERFAGESVMKIFPETKTVIGLAFRVLRGSYRGVEEGSTYYQYSTTGVETLEETVMPMALLQVSSLLEEEGYIAVPQRRTQQILPGEGMNPELNTDGIRRNLPQETMMDFDRAAILCGLGERGLSGALLTDRFGPFQRVCFILTDAELEETPLAEPHLCDRCGECVKACPGHALAEDGSRDDWQCGAYYRGAAMSTNPFMPPDAYASLPNRKEIIRGEARLDAESARAVMAQTYFYPGIRHGYAASICGRACDRACYAHLEEKGVLTAKFRTKFRKRPPFELPELPDPLE